MKTFNFIIVFFALTLYACQENKYPELTDGVYAEFITSKGTFVAQLYHDKTPKTVANFVDLAQGKNALADSTFQGKPFYNGLIFHRVIKDFMIQGGDPQGTGSGGPGYKFPDEIVDGLVHNKKGILSMANSGPATNGSQFFITLKETPWLDGRHTVFGEIVLGQEIVDAIGVVTTGAQDKPTEDVIMQEVNIIIKGKITLNSFEKEMEEIEKERLAKEERLKSVKEATLAELDNWSSKAEELPSGLRIVFTEKGDGPQPKDGQTVMMHYEGYLSDGSLFDSSVLEVVEKYEMVDDQRKALNQYNPLPAEYSANAGLIAGFREGMLQMKVGDEAILFIPSYLGYGERGAGSVIPPNADIIFRLKIVEIMQ